MEFASSKGTLHYILEGKEDKPVLMFIHGVGMNLSAFKAQVVGLKDDYRLLCVDLPGHGGSYEPQSFTYKETGEVFLELLNHLNIDKVVMVGVSLGGHVAQYMAFNYEDKVRGVVDIGSLGLHMKPSKSMKLLMPLALQFARLLPEKLFCKMFAKDKAVKKENIENLFETSLKTGKKKIMQYSFAMLREMKMPIPHPIKQPVLIIHGEKEVGFIKKGGAKWDKETSNTTRHLLKDAGHVATGDAPDAVNALIADFAKAL